MSPATKRKKGAPREVKGEGSKKVTVKVNGTGIEVLWLCGGGRTFSIEELRKQIDYVDGIGSKHELWLNLTDSHGAPFYVRLKDGKLTANDGIGENGFISWANLKRALQATIAEMLG